ncbi:translation initiation factor IF-2-like [Camelus ferus]|uniref:Translation initiation factor IF-2-like n=1 Tax=Camelus ferus TaxID=419612 RepID=A0A8B8TIL7_CAMFR|nr:translation initiation factor IF-2-like [Camelus ferus]
MRGRRGWGPAGAPPEPPSEVPVSAWGRLSTAAPEGCSERLGEGGRSSCAATACGRSPRRGSVSWQRGPCSGRTLPLPVGLPSPIEAPRSQSPGTGGGAQQKRVFPVGLPSRVHPAQPPGTRPETCTTPPRPRARPGRRVETLERRESRDRGFQDCEFRAPS